MKLKKILLSVLILVVAGAGICLFFFRNTRFGEKYPDKITFAEGVGVGPEKISKAVVRRLRDGVVYETQDKQKITGFYEKLAFHSFDKNLDREVPDGGAYAVDFYTSDSPGGYLRFTTDVSFEKREGYEGKSTADPSGGPYDADDYEAVCRIAEEFMNSLAPAG